MKKIHVILARWWWHTPLIPAFGRQRKADFCGFDANLIYKPCLEKPKRKIHVILKEQQQKILRSLSNIKS